MANVPHNTLTGTDLHVNKAYRTTFTSANLTNSILSVNHALSQKYVKVTVYDNADKEVIPTQVVPVDANNVNVDLTNITVSGTWQVTVTM